MSARVQGLLVKAKECWLTRHRILLGSLAASLALVVWGRERERGDEVEEGEENSGRNNITSLSSYKGLCG